MARLQARSPIVNCQVNRIIAHLPSSSTVARVRYSQVKLEPPALRLADAFSDRLSAASSPGRRRGKARHRIFAHRRKKAPWLSPAGPGASGTGRSPAGGPDAYSPCPGIAMWRNSQSLQNASAPSRDDLPRRRATREPRLRVTRHCWRSGPRRRFLQNSRSVRTHRSQASRAACLLRRRSPPAWRGRRRRRGGCRN